ncbi:hypothetical protein ACS0TY_027453 [Phlomoides rotata]
MGHFARVLVEVDLKQEREEFLLFERAGHCSFVGITYECVPDFCNFCNLIGHITGHCGGQTTRQRQGKAAATSTIQKGDTTKDATTVPVGCTKQWVQRTFPSAPVRDPAAGDKGNGVQVDIPCCNSFDVLKDSDGADIVGTEDALESQAMDTETDAHFNGIPITREDQLQKAKRDESKKLLLILQIFFMIF